MTGVAAVGEVELRVVEIGVGRVVVPFVVQGNAVFEFAFDGGILKLKSNRKTGRVTN